MDRLHDIKAIFKQWCRGKGGELDKEDIEWLIEQAEKAMTYKNSLENISNILEGQNVTELVERIACELSHSGIYDKE